MSARGARYCTPRLRRHMGLRLQIAGLTTSHSNGQGQGLLSHEVQASHSSFASEWNSLDLYFTCFRAHRRQLSVSILQRRSNTKARQETTSTIHVNGTANTIEYLWRPRQYEMTGSYESTAKTALFKMESRLCHYVEVRSLERTPFSF